MSARTGPDRNTQIHSLQSRRSNGPTAILADLLKIPGLSTSTSSSTIPQTVTGPDKTIRGASANLLVSLDQPISLGSSTPKVGLITRQSKVDRRHWHTKGLAETNAEGSITLH